MTLRLARIKDIDLIYNWVNKEDSISNKLLTNNVISQLEHKEWFENSIKNKNRFIWIIEEENRNIGQLRFDIKDMHNRCFIDIYIDKEYRNKNYAKKAINEAIDYIKSNNNINCFVAKVLKSNFNSLKFFKKLGFKEYKKFNTYYELILMKNKSYE